MVGTLRSLETTTYDRSAIAPDLRSVLARFADSDGPHETAIEGLRFHRYSHPACSRFGPALSFVAQGEKRVTLGAEKYDYDDDHSFQSDYSDESARAQKSSCGCTKRDG